MFLYFYFLSFLCKAASDGEVTIQLHSYNNPLSKSLLEQTCSGQCVNTFLLTISKYVRLGSGLVEEISQIESTDNIGDVESFTASSLGSRWDNPLRIPFAGSARLKITLIVYGVEKNYPNNEYKMAEYSVEEVGIQEERVTLLSGSTSLTLSYKISCSAYYYKDCAVHCSPVPAQFICNTDTGSRICLEGWRGQSCDVKDGSEPNPDTDSESEESKSEQTSWLDTSELWKIIAICGGVVIGCIIVAGMIWYQTRYKPRRSCLPTIVVSNEKFFKKSGFIPDDVENDSQTEPSAPKECKPPAGRLTSSSIPNINNNSTPPPVEQPDLGDG